MSNGPAPLLLSTKAVTQFLVTVLSFLVAYVISKMGFHVDPQVAAYLSTGVASIAAFLAAWAVKESNQFLETMYTHRVRVGEIVVDPNVVIPKVVDVVKDEYGEQLKQYETDLEAWTKRLEEDNAKAAKASPHSDETQIIETVVRTDD